ncbi:MAG: RNA methyltransferase [Cellvibrionaceae bacterium]|nr:RNA methyltransferase [Cellvibrionaceae bacterium]
MTTDSPAYLEKKKFFNRVLTVYGRKPVLEALANPKLACFRLHLARSNRPSDALKQLLSLAAKKGTEVCYHDKQALARISKNARQDQGVALDLTLDGLKYCDDFFLSNSQQPFEMIALDNITNPQNLGMIIRSVCASPITALLLPQRGCAALDSLVIKASAGTLFKSQILLCSNLQQGLALCKQQGAKIYGLDAKAPLKLSQLPPNESRVFILGNETQGLSQAVEALCDNTVSIPMRNEVESLNVAVTASLIAFRSVF